MSSLPFREVALEPVAVVGEASGVAREIRDWIIAQLAEALKVPAATIDCAAPLHSLGADSVTALMITGALAEWLGRELPATLMWDHGSIDEIAAALGVAPCFSPHRSELIAWNTRGKRRALFCFPGINGYPVNVAALGTELGSDQPCYGLTSPGLDGASEPLDRVEAIAATMLGQIATIQPRGPYQLLGYSFGGLLAYEAARQLAAAGERTSLLAIFDTFTPEGLVVRPPWQRVALHAYLLLSQTGRRDYLRKCFEQLRRGQRRRALLREASAFSPGEALERQALAVQQASERASAHYRPPRSAGPLLLLRATQYNTETWFFRMDRRLNGWGGYIDGELRVIELACGHYEMLAGEQLRRSVEALRPHLAD